jgi:hypothetical protein
MNTDALRSPHTIGFAFAVLAAVLAIREPLTKVVTLLSSNALTPLTQQVSFESVKAVPHAAHHASAKDCGGQCGACSAACPVMSRKPL